MHACAGTALLALVGRFSLRALETQNPRGAGAVTRRSGTPTSQLDRPSRRRSAASLGLLPARTPDGRSGRA